MSDPLNEMKVAGFDFVCFNAQTDQREYEVKHLSPHNFHILEFITFVGK